MSNDESRRLKALASLPMDQTAQEERIDRITRNAVALFDVPIAMINLVTADRVRFKACVGLPQGNSLDRHQSFCSLAASQENPLMIEDAVLDPDFKDNPLVIGELQIRSYTGKSLHASDGSRIGTLCLLDTKPRKYTFKQLQLLEDLAKWAEIEINAHIVG